VDGKVYADWRHCLHMQLAARHLLSHIQLWSRDQGEEIEQDVTTLLYLH